MFEPTLTTSSPVIVPAKSREESCAYELIDEYCEEKEMNMDVPEMMTIFFASPATAEVRASSEVTVVVAPPDPPVVLLHSCYVNASWSASLSAQVILREMN